MKKRNRFFRTGIVAVCNVVILAVFLFFFFGGRDFSLEQKEDARLIGASYMTMNNEFYTIISEEVAYRVEAEGDRMILRDPALDSGRQASQIRELLDMGISALVVAPADADSLADVLTEARDRGVKVIVVDTAVADDIPADCTITSDNYEAGVIIGKYFLQKHNTAKLVVMTHESARSARERVGGFLDTVSANENIQVVKKIECEGQVEIAMPRLQEAIDEGLDFDTVFCLNDLAGMWKTWKRKSAERLCRRCFCENGAAGRVAGRPGRGTGSKRKPVVPRRQRKNREEERKSGSGGAWGAKGSLWCPAAKEKAGKKRENPRRAGHREQKEALIPRLPSINRSAWDKRASLIKLLGEQYLFSDFYTTTDAVRAGAQYFAGFDSLQLLTYGTAGFLTELVQQFFGKLVGRSLGGGILDVSVTVLHASQHDST